MDSSVPTLVADEEAASEKHFDFPVVGIGASAGGVSALIRLFEALPDRTGMAFVVIVHLSPEHESSIDSILGRATGMPVLQVREATPIEADHVYVISPALQLSMTDGHLAVSELDRSAGGHVAIDVFFRTLAQVQRDLAFCVVLSGTGSDGALGVRRVKELGGIAIAQSPDDAEYSGMPNSAVATGAVDFVLPAADIGERLVVLWENAQRIALPELKGTQDEKERSNDEFELGERALVEIMRLLKRRTGHDFRHYKRATVLRRLERRLQVNALSTLPEYLRFLEEQPSEAPALLKDLLISVTNFFRDPGAFDALATVVDADLPSTSAGRRTLRAWVAGCATGEEAYSVAMLLSELSEDRSPELELQVFASDIDARAIALARIGLYPNTIVTDVTPTRLRRYFVNEQGQVRVRKELREKVLFAAHDVLRDPPFSNLDLVCCRNLLIYLDREVQAQVLEVFHFALRPGGLLFLGTSESADAAGDLFVTVDKKQRIYRADGAARRTRQLPGTFRTVAAVPHALRAGDTEGRETLGNLHAKARAEHLSPSVLINSEYGILHSTGATDTFLRFAPGQPSRNLLDVVRPELRIELRAALYQARRSGQSVEARKVKLHVDGQAVWMTMLVRPLSRSESAFMLVQFDQAQVTFAPEAVGGDQKDPMLTVLEDELQRTREQLSGSLGESAASNEELRASNEELQAINEELRSTTEELETSKEELQSVNEELVTVNQELKSKVEEASIVNDDLKNLLASTDIATIFVDRRMRIKRFTPRASRLFNLIASDVGRSLLDITHRLQYPQLEHDAVEAFESLRPVEREIVGDGNDSYLVRAMPYRTQNDVIGGAVLSFVDITSTRRAEERLRAGEANLHRVLESTQDYAIISTDTQGIVTAWNLGATRIFGYPEDEILGQSIDLIFTPQDRAAGMPDRERRLAREEGRAEDERWHLARDGRAYFCSGIMTPLYERDVLVGYAKIARDLTDSKRTQNHLQALLLQEKEIRTELQRAMTTKDEFLAVVSHELKNPLNLIQVNAELLARMPEVRDSPAVLRSADVIRRAVSGQAKIIDDLLDLSRLRTGKLSMSVNVVDWSAIVARVLEAVAGDAQAAGLTLRSELDPQASVVRADPVRAEQIVWNLLSNTLKFTPSGGTVVVRLTRDGLLGRLDVVDTGRGIAPEFLAHVFDMFRQADRSTTRSQGGMGIGLALVKQLAEEHGGKVAVASEGLDHGSTFSVWLPLSDSPASVSAGSSGVPALQGLRVLVVDDSADALESLATLLRLEGADVVTAPDGPGCLAVVQDTSFDLILSDIAMPGMDGYELIKVLRERPGTAEVHAIALTGFGRPEDAKRARAAGYDAHVTKPVVMDHLLQTITSFSRGGGVG